MQTLNRRKFLVSGSQSVLASRVLLGVVAAEAITFEAGCTPASVIGEAGNILTFIAPLGDGAAAIVEIVDPAIAPAVTLADGVYDVAVKALEDLLAKWSTASAATQPDLLDQIEAAAQTLSADAAQLIAAAQVKSTAAAARIAAIFGAVTSEISALLNLIPQLKAAGGTTTALQHMGIASKVKFAGYKKAEAYRSDLVKQLAPTGDAAVDAKLAALNAKLNGLQLAK